MDKKVQDKSSNFFKREGFYVVLFICLCVVAIVAAFTAKNARVSTEKPKVAQETSVDNGKEKVTSKTEEEKKTVDNATEVKNNNKNNATVSTAKDGKNSTQVSNTSNGKFINPVEGTLAKGFSTIPEYTELGKAVFNTGIHIKADAGKSVKSVLDGVVSKIYVVKENNKELVDSNYRVYGNYVEVTHPNGLVTRYASLDPNVAVKQGQKVKQGDVIGKIGNSSISYSMEKYGSHLGFSVFKNNNEEDPLKHVKYTTQAQK
ncbi:M23 family metallopeptidase [Clostridium hydrogeniformans]|uniref:M23 family metallopeptidase n=1 Tax=Clostridium hydrogeniformans TaxID=349933 RepID=UPI00048843AF|nr:M23 family metallopeptidase [Clostridium hydrogeniformans]